MFMGHVNVVTLKSRYLGFATLFIIVIGKDLLKCLHTLNRKICPYKIRGVCMFIDFFRFFAILFKSTVVVPIL